MPMTSKLIDFMASTTDAAPDSKEGVHGLPLVCPRAKSRAMIAAMRSNSAAFTNHLCRPHRSRTLRLRSCETSCASSRRIGCFLREEFAVTGSSLDAAIFPLNPIAISGFEPPGNGGTNKSLLVPVFQDAPADAARPAWPERMPCIVVGAAPGATFDMNTDDA